LTKHGISYITEAIFDKYKARPDVVAMNGVIYEVLGSETEEMFECKKEYYPPQFEVRKIKAVEKIEDWNEKIW